MTGPERRAILIARGVPTIGARKLAKLAGIKIDVARRIIAAEQERRVRA